MLGKHTLPHYALTHGTGTYVPGGQVLLNLYWRTQGKRPAKVFFPMPSYSIAGLVDPVEIIMVSIQEKSREWSLLQPVQPVSFHTGLTKVIPYDSKVAKDDNKISFCHTLLFWEANIG